MYGRLEKFSVSAAGRAVNDYRIRKGILELRTWDPETETNSVRKNPWRKLDADEIMLHLVLDTVVGKWLMQRRGSQHLAGKKAGLRKSGMNAVQPEDGPLGGAVS